VASARQLGRVGRQATARRNAASQKVLTKAGFVPVGPADPAHLGGKPGTWYQRDLVLRDTSEMKITNYGWSTGAGH
jgi:ribosomal-protein-alanine N-acetyltransferase